MCVPNPPDNIFLSQGDMGMSLIPKLTCDEQRRLPEYAVLVLTFWKVRTVGLRASAPVLLGTHCPLSQRGHTLPPPMWSQSAEVWHQNASVGCWFSQMLMET